MGNFALKLNLINLFLFSASRIEEVAAMRTKFPTKVPVSVIFECDFFLKCIFCLFVIFIFYSLLLKL